MKRLPGLFNFKKTDEEKKTKLKIKEILDIKDDYNEKEIDQIINELKSYYSTKFDGEGDYQLKKALLSTLEKDELRHIIAKSQLILTRESFRSGYAQLYKNLVDLQSDKIKDKIVEEKNVLTSYSLVDQFVDAKIVDDNGQIKYIVVEPSLTEKEKEQLHEIKGLLRDELDYNLNLFTGNKERIEEYLTKHVEKIIKNYRITIEIESLRRILYYILRDFVHFGKIEPLLKDRKIEDISCNGSNIPIYIWHHEYESIPTNVIFEDSQELDEFILKLTYATGRTVSIAQPVVDATLPDGSRLFAAYEKEVTRRGSSFTIRKFHEKPLTVVDLIYTGTISSEMAAWFWYAIENQSSVLVVGGTASGKTTTINALSMFIKPTSKIVSIEDTAELQLPHENWLPTVARIGFGTQSKQAEISLFDLLKSALRQRPEYIIVGEVRGAEAYALAQAIATGHGGLATMHADSVQATIHRLENEPMNIPRPLITTIDTIVVQAKIKLESFMRRIFSVCEVIGLDPVTNEILINEIFKWNPGDDSYGHHGRSYILDKITKARGISHDQVLKEVQKRQAVIDWMVEKNIHEYRDVIEIVRSYYLEPAKLLKKIGIKGDKK